MSSDVNQVKGPPSAEPSPGGESRKQRGRLQRPNTAERAARLIRVSTVRLVPDDETWRLLRRRASKASAFRNKMIQARVADARGWRVPEDQEREPKPFTRNGDTRLVPFNLQKLVRETERGELSSSIAIACETEVQKDWTRDGKKIMAGAKLPQYTGNNVGLATISGRPGVKFHDDGAGGYIAELNVTADKADGDNWIRVPVHKGTKKDEFRLPLLYDFATGAKKILAARIVFKLHRGLTLLQLTYAVEALKPVMGQRKASLVQLTDGEGNPGNVFLRVDGTRQSLDYTSRVRYLESLELQRYGLAKRLNMQIGWRRGHAKLKREKLAEAGFDRHADTLLHQWSREIADWLRKQGVNQLTVVGLVGGSWPAHKLMERLKYKCEEGGCKVVEHGEFDDESVKRAVQAEASKASRKARANATAAKRLLQRRDKRDG